MYTSVVAPAVISADSPRFLGFIPAAPTKASLLFDMLVSCASIQGISWLEAAGAIHAENQVLRLIADRAGLPPSAGGCFVSGGSAGNLSALVVAREVAKRRGRGRGRGRRLAGGGQRRRALLDRQHAADPGDGPADRAAPTITGSPAPRCGRRSRPTATRLARRRRGDVGHHQRRHHRRPGRRRRRSPASTACGSTWTAPTAAPGCSRRASGARYDGIEHADSFIVDPHKWLFAPFDCAALLYRDPALARSVHTAGRLATSTSSTTTPGEWNPTDYAYHLTRRARGLPLWFSLAVYGVDAYTEAIEARDRAGPADRRRRSGPATTWS